MSLRPLSLLETRVLGVLVEKQHTVPDSYPLSLNALTLGCNQKTARDPVLNATEAEVQDAVDALRALSLVFESSGSRVARYEHNAGRVLALPSQSVALLAVLMLRGPQTASELRANCERLHRFADISSVEGFLDELATKEPARVQRLARAPGSREPRWAHRLCGELAEAVVAVPPDGEGSVAAVEVAALKAEVARLGTEIQRLDTQLKRILSELGLDPIA